MARADRYGAVAEWVALPADKCQGKRLFDLVALTDATTGQPKVAPVAGLLEYMLAMAQGNAQSVPKGGEPAYRDTYSAKVFGKGQGEMMRRHEREFGYGPTAGKPFAFKTIEQKTYAIRWWHARVRAPHTTGRKRAVRAGGSGAATKAEGVDRLRVCRKGGRTGRAEDARK